MRLDVVTEPLSDRFDEAFELGILERRELSAAVADRVVVVFARRVSRLVAGGAVDVESPDKL